MLGEWREGGGEERKEGRGGAEQEKRARGGLGPIRCFAASGRFRIAANAANSPHQCGSGLEALAKLGALWFGLDLALPAR